VFAERKTRERMPMTKKDLAKAIAEKRGLTRGKVGEVVQRVFDGIAATLVDEGRIELRNFGVFKVRKRKLRKTRNLRTGEDVFVPAKLVVTFKPGRQMEERVGRSQKATGGAAAAATPSGAAKRD
jgi:nucleoid DNA-binding protein